MTREEAWSEAEAMNRQVGDETLRTRRDRRVFYVAEESPPGDWRVVEKKGKKGFWGWMGDILTS